MILEIKDFISLGVSGLSACVAIFAAYMARTAVHSQRRADRWATNHDLLARASTMLADNPSLLGLHGITTDDLAQDDISVEEFSYVYLSMDAGSAYYQVGGDRQIELTDFRKNFLRNHKVQKIWTRYLRERMFSTGPFAHAVDRYIAHSPGHENLSRTAPKRQQSP